MTDLLVPPSLGSAPRQLVAGLPDRLPQPRGQVSEQLLDRLVCLPHEISPLPLEDVSVIADDDVASAPETRSLSSYVQTQGTVDQLRELAIHRSAYQLKEADPHTWGIPRLTGRAKAALVEIRRGEYGNGDIARVHANLFAEVLDALDVDHRYAAHLDRLPGVTLSTGNLMSYFGLHRRWRGALVGHLALFEMCSVRPMARYADALRRVGVADHAVRFYDEHVRADAHHGVVALDEMVMGLLEAEPILGGEVVFGARALDAVERLFADHVLDAWGDGRSSLRPAESAPHLASRGSQGDEDGPIA